MYDSFSTEYDYFVNWPSRLTYEMPFLLEMLGKIPADKKTLSVLDAACGSGMHALALADQGYSVSGVDYSEGMIMQAHKNTTNRQSSVEFHVAGFKELANILHTSPRYPFNALLCLGNSLPHVLSLIELEQTIQDFSVCLKSGGLLLIQNRNFDALMQQQERWMTPQSYREDNQEWLFIRFYDFLPNGLINFHVLRLKRDGENWQQLISSTLLFPILQADLLQILAKHGFESIECFGSMQTGDTFNPDSSGNLIVSAWKK
jgi:ubiquinone/menaquinone biosynthesis C-methylase UbiE